MMERKLEDVFQRQQAHQYILARTTAAERIAKLRRLHASVLRHRESMKAAMAADFHKPSHEVDISETLCVNSEIRHMIRNLPFWMQARRVGVRLPLLGSSARIVQEPKGVCLILGPWNFPFNLNLIPLASAVAAGNCVVLKPSEHVPHSTAVLRSIVEDCFSPEEVVVVEGGVEVATQLLELPFNHVFFTGSTAVGKKVMAAAARHLASVTLELGGKSPVIVDETADLDRAASRIVWLKCMNGGQTCIAPDYVLVQASVHDALVKKIRSWYEKFYGATAELRLQSPDLSRAVHQRQFQFVKSLLDDATARGGQIASGGFTDPATRFVDLTVLTDVPDEATVWSEEIFGPVLPVRRYEQLEEAVQYINAGDKPLAFYIFSRREQHIRRVIEETRGGGVCINECGLQFFNPELPFGGHNGSGLGKYHGESGFREFSNPRSIARQHSPYPTTQVFLPPYGSRLMRLALDWISKWL